MIKNYLKSALRNILRYRFISFINLFGLTVGFTCCLLIVMYVMYELSYDKYHKNAGNIYRVERTFINAETGSVSLALGAVAPPFAPLLKNDFKEIQEITSILPTGTTTVRYEDKIFNENKVYFADEKLFTVFDVKLVKGNPTNALRDPYSVMLTEELASKYFGSESAINKILRLDNQFIGKVTGVYKRMPGNSHWDPEVIISFNTLKDSAIYGEEALRTNWGNNAFYTYMLLPDNYNPKELEAQFPAFINRHLADGGDAQYKPSDWTSLNLTRLTDIHLYSHKDSEIGENGDIKRVYIFSAIALFILIIACINYMNLSTARSALRAKEIGVRKVVGADRKELILQFLAESVLLCAVASVCSIILVGLTLGWLNDVTGLTLTLGTLVEWRIILVFLLVPVIVGVSAGLYPAVFLSSFKPVQVLSGIFKVGNNTLSFRRALVIVQFSASIILIICTAIVFQQLRYVQTRSLGFSKDQIVTVNNNAGLNTSYDAFKTALMSDPAIRGVGRSSRIPSGRLLDAQGSQINRGDSLAPTKVDIKFVRADEDFIPVYQVKVLAGRNFSKEFGTDSSAFLVNEAAVQALGLRSNEDAVGKEFSYGGQKGRLIGVFQNFNFESLHQRILPIVMLQSAMPNGYGNISIKVDGDMQRAITHIETTWRRFLPDTPFDYTFLDARFADLYKAEQQQYTIFTIFSCVAIFIACLGLFGLSAFTITQRVKEIGIRKVLGASVGSIVNLISKEFLMLVVVSTFVAFPIAWFAMYKWLNDFAYRISIAWWVFILSGVIALVVAFATISVQVIKAALNNPVKSLRSQ